MLEEQLKKIKADMKDTTFKDFEFGPSQRQAVFHKLKGRNINENGMTKIKNKRDKNGFRGFLTVLAYCGMLTLIGSIVADNLNNSTKNIPDNGTVVDQPDETPVKNPEQEGLLNSKDYQNEVYPFKLIIPDSWLQKVKLHNQENGISFIYVGQDGMQQELFTIQVNKLEDRLKFIYEGGPDPSKDFALLDDHVYRYSYPLDMSLTAEEDLQIYELLSAEIPKVIESFAFIDNKSGFIGETPYIYGFTPHFNDVHGFEVNTPNKWQNLYKVEQSNNEMKFLFQKQGAEPTVFLSFKALSPQEWEDLQANKQGDKEYTLITTKDGFTFIAVTTKQNPFEESELFYPYEMLRTEAALVIETFQFLD